MDDPPITHEQMALALESVREYVAAMVSMAVTTERPDWPKHADRFKKADKDFLDLVAAFRGAEEKAGD